MFHCVQVCLENGLILGKLKLKEKVDSPNIIQVNENFDTGNKKYDFETKSFVEYVPEPEQEKEVLEEPGVIAE